MPNSISSLIKFLPLVIWFLLSGIGGIWLARAFFRLNSSNEETLIGISIGLISVTWIINLLGRVVPMFTACLLAAGILFLAGLISNFPKKAADIKGLFLFKMDHWLGLTILVLFLIFFSIGVGMGIYDENPVLPLVSQMAAGDIPPHFALDPKVVYNYHYFPYLFSAQIMRVGDFFPWTALDMQRSIFLVLSLVLIGLWVNRITHNRLAGIAAGVFAFFAGGTRWLLLLLPAQVIDALGNSISRLDSGLNSGETLRIALTNPWAAQGTGPYSIPFAYANGFNGSAVIGLGATNYTVMFFAIFLMTFNRWKGWKSIFINIILLATLGFVHEISYVMVFLGALIVTLVSMILNRTLKIPRQMLYLIIALFISGIIVLFQGGVITGIFQQLINHPQLVEGMEESYQSVAFSFTFPPQIVDAHLGALSLLNPLNLFVILIEIGPMLFLLPAALTWGVKAVKTTRWFEAILIAMIIISLSLSFFQMSMKAGSLGAIARAQNFFLVILKFFAVPIILIWLMKQSQTRKIIIYCLFAITIFGGIVVFGLEMLAMQKPILSMGYDALDAKILRNYWNKLDDQYLVFDSKPIRAAVLFGRATDAAYEWYKFKPEFYERFNNPDPYHLKKDGFGYIYLDQNDLRSLPSSVKSRLESDCVITLADYKDDFGSGRTLLDIRACN